MGHIYKDNSDCRDLQAPQSAYDFLSHQMRTKVGIIIGSVEMLKINEVDMDAKSQEDLDRIGRAAERLIDLIVHLEARQGPES